MTPDQLKAIAALATILKMFGSTPFSVVLVIISIGPWVGMLLASNSVARRTAEANERSNQANERINQAIAESTERSNQVVADQNARIEKAHREFRELVNAIISAHEKRFEEVVRMYENNVVVVKNYHGLASDLTGIITLSTRTLETLAQKIDNNQFCPLVRKETGKT